MPVDKTEIDIVANDLPPALPPVPQRPGGLSADTRAMMVYEANKKTVLAAYLLWFFVGLFGAHNFYLKRTGVAITQLILSLTAVGVVVTIFWVLVDAFLIPGWVANQNNVLAAQLGAYPA